MTPEQQQLFTKAHENLRAAKILTAEAIYSIAVSRAYYAMFYVAEAFLVGENLTFSKHSAVISKFGEIFASTGRIPSEFHRHLIQAQQSRTRADYDASAQITEAEAITQIQRAQDLIAFAENYL